MECPRRFEAERSARDSQLVCGAACRKARRARLARERRAKDPDGARVDERRRKARSRAKEREEAPSAPAVDTARGDAKAGGPDDAAEPAGRGCHELPSACNPSMSRTDIGRIVDATLRMSRATLGEHADTIAQEISLTMGL